MSVDGEQIMSVKTVFGNVMLVMSIQNGKKYDIVKWDGNSIDEAMIQIDQGEGGNPAYRYIRFKNRKAGNIVDNMPDISKAFAEMQKAVPTDVKGNLEQRLAALEAENAQLKASASKPRRKVTAK
jgi:hypothetical protein